MKSIAISTFTLLVLSATSALIAQSTVEVEVLTDKVLVIHIDEGYFEHATNGQAASSGVGFVETVTETAIPILSNYSIVSSDDPNYASPLNPLALNRKTKPTDFLDACETFQFLPFYNIVGCQNITLDRANEHWIYLELPSALVSGNSYSITVNNLMPSSPNNFSFTFDEKVELSDAIHVNNIAYSTEAELKYGYVYHWQGDGGSLDLSAYAGNQFQLINEQTNAAVFSGSLQFRKNEFTLETQVADSQETPGQNFNGATVYECDFSTFNTPGEYFLTVAGIGRSNSFSISCNALRLPFESVMKGLYQNRSGIELTSPFTATNRPAPHNPVLTPGFAGKLKYTNAIFCDASTEDGFAVDSALYTNNIVGDINTAGWYQDAGDWDAYVRHMEVPAKLMFTYEHFANNFIDGQLNLPESGNGIPDILDEARWLLHFYKRLKDETEAAGYTTGGVPGGRIFGDLWGLDLGTNNIIRGSWEDNDRIWVVTAEEAVMTFYYAAVAAHYQWLLDEYNFTDPDNIDWETEAVDAFTWANNLYSSSYSCHRYEIYHMKNYAASALLRLTSNSFYNAEFVSSWDDAGITLGQEIQGEQAFGAYIYMASSNQTRDVATLAEVEANVEFTGDFFLTNFIDDRACRWGGNPYFPMIVGHGTTPYVFEGIMAYALLKASQPAKAANYLKYLYTTVDYFLGTNPLNMTWITGLGERSPYGVLHLDSWATGNGVVKPGIVPYGPWRREAYSVMGPFDLHWPEQYVHPPIDDWPGHERWFEQRYAPLTTEFTINQNSVNAAAVYGALSGTYDCTPTTGIANIGLEIDCIKVYPNPFDEYFKVQGVLEDYKLEILDVAGNIVSNLPNTGTELSINTNNLGAGMFFLKVYDPINSQVCVQKIIKME